MRLRQSAVWAFRASTLTLATGACGGVSTTVSDDASVEAGSEAEAPDAEGAEAQTDAATPGDAGEDDALAEAGGSRCDVFIGVDYGAAPCR